TSQIDNLPVAVYKLHFNELLNELFLSKNSDKFELPEKVYGFESKFVERLIKTYKETSNNLGVLLNGLKGTGKTVTGKVFCNNINLPIIIVDAKYDILPSFINSIQQDIVLFFDEYEKVYDDYDDSLLSVMD